MMTALQEIPMYCGICDVVMGHGRDVQYLPCRHMFHTACLEMMNPDFLCPHCRRIPGGARQSPAVDYMMYPPQPGDWLRPKPNFGEPGTPTPMFYLLPPSENLPESRLRRQDVGEFGAQTYFGPVHAVERTQRFVSCLVPHPNTAEAGLVWVNVQANESGRTYCRVVPRRQVRAWRRRGWKTSFLDEENGDAPA